MPPTDWNARTGEFTPPGMDCLARANWRSFSVIPRVPPVGEDARELDREVGEHGIGAGPADAEHGLEDRAVAVDPAVGRRRRDHRVLAADLVGPDGHGRDCGGVGENVEVAHRGLDHDDVGALGDVELDLA